MGHSQGGWPRCRGDLEMYIWPGRTQGYTPRDDPHTFDPGGSRDAHPGEILGTVIRWINQFFPAENISIWHGYPTYMYMYRATMYSSTSQSTLEYFWKSSTSGTSSSGSCTWVLLFINLACKMFFPQIRDIGGLPENVLDMWEVTGKRPEARYTWDTTRNDNLGMDPQRRAKCRFDRVYMRHSTPPQLRAVHFELVGLERLKSCQRFPSDHWGVMTHYDKITKSAKTQ